MAAAEWWLFIRLQKKFGVCCLFFVEFPLPKEIVFRVHDDIVWVDVAKGCSACLCRSKRRS
eukprot:4139356-Amphidinium_carterae.1